MAKKSKVATEATLPAGLAAKLAFSTCDSALTPMTGWAGVKGIGTISGGIIDLWQVAAAIRDAADNNDQRAFEDAYRRAIELHKVHGPKYLAYRHWFINANSAMGGVRIECLGRTFASAHQCLFDLATGMIFAASAENNSEKYIGSINGENDGNLGSLFPIKNWPALREAITKLQAMDMTEIIDIARRETAKVLVHAKPESPPRTDGIEPEHRTRPMSKREAAKYLGRPNVDSGVKWLNACIEDGTIHYERLSRQTGIYDCTQFPAKVQSRILPK